MKKLIFIVLVLLFVVGCTFDFNSSNVFNISVLDGDTGTSYDISCTSDVKYKKGAGVITDNKCLFFLEIPDKGTYRCEIGFNTGGKPITENTTLKESCDIDIKK